MRWLFWVLVFPLALSAGDYSNKRNGYGEIVVPLKRPLTWEAIEKEAPRLGTVEALLAWIDENYAQFFQNFTLMRESHSLQTATPSHPRAIVFQNGGDLILTFNSPEMPGADRVEVMQFRKASRKYEFRELRYRPGHVETSQADPSTCRRCHGAPLRPIWAPYSVWPGAYGKFNDGIPDYDGHPPSYGSAVPEEYSDPDPRVNEAVRERNVAEEREQLKGYLAFREVQPKHPRYRFLKFDPKATRAPYGDDRHHIGSLRPNLNLTHLLSENYASQVARAIVGNACFEKLAPQLLEEWLGCTSTDLSPFREAIHRRYGKLNETFAMNSRSLPISLLQVLGFDHASWHPGENPKGWNYFAGIIDFSSLVADHLYTELRRHTPSLPEFSPMDDTFYPDKSNDPQLDDASAESGEERPAPPPLPRELRYRAACKALAAKPTVVTTAEAVQCLDASAKARAAGALSTCLACHAHGEANAPVMPFDDTRWLTPSRKAAARERILRTDKQAMPPERQLSIFEREALLRYFAE